MKNTSLVILLLLAIMIAVIGLNLKYQKEGFATALEVLSRNPELKPYIDNMKEVEIRENTQIPAYQVLSQMDANVIPIYNPNGGLDNPYIGGPYIFDSKAQMRNENALKNVSCREMGFDQYDEATNACLYDIYSVADLANFQPIANNIYKLRGKPYTDRADTGLVDLQNIAAEANILSSSNSTLTGSKTVASTNATTAQTNLNTLSTTGTDLTRTYGQLSTTGATLQTDVTQKDTRLKNERKINTIFATQGTWPRSILFDGSVDNCLIRKRFKAPSWVNCSVGNTADMNRMFVSTTETPSYTYVYSFDLPNEDLFCMEYTGFMKVNQAGNYTFGLRSDDASDFAIYLDSKWVIVTQAYGCKPPEIYPPSPGTVNNLIAGSYYPIRVRFHENYGGQALILEWKTPSVSSWAPVPFSVFSANPSPTGVLSREIVTQNGYPDPTA